MSGPARKILSAVGALVLSACDQGNITVAVADAPVDGASRIVVQFTGVVLEHSNGRDTEFAFSPPVTVDLLAQTQGRSAVLVADEQVEDGPYSAIRLQVEAGEEGIDSFVELDDGSIHALHLPEANEGGLRIGTSYTVERQEHLSLVIDFDLRRSVLDPEIEGEPYELSPVLRLIDVDSAGEIAGTVSQDLAGGEDCRPAVYLYAGHDTAPDDAGSAAPPLTSALVDESSGNFSYHAAFLPAGDYTAAFTCEADDDDPALDDTIVFMATANASVVARETLELDFF